MTIEPSALHLIGLIANVVIVLVIIPQRKSIEDLNRSDKELVARIQALEIKVAENYVVRPEIAKDIEDMASFVREEFRALHERLDRLDQTKQDKH